VSEASQLAKASLQKKRTTIRSPAGKSLRKLAAEAQLSRSNVAKNLEAKPESVQHSNLVTAVCVADEYNMQSVVRILRMNGFTIDPFGTGFAVDEVVHTRGVNNGDIFVFPSGTVVAWSLPGDAIIDIATKILLPAAVCPRLNQLEIEDLEFTEDHSRETSQIKGDIITLGTKKEAKVDTTLAKIAFSSGLARSTKLAVLESMLSRYSESTRSIPRELAEGRLPLGRDEILKKSGELLELRAQLNHYSELTDSLPDIFWDSRHELGLETYYDQVGKALDVGIRIKTLNDKIGFAQEIAGALSTKLNENHSHFLEKIIIWLIVVEVIFGLKREVMELWEYMKDGSDERPIDAAEKQSHA
jgi:uncharacterized Rmd1/YagE family protein